MSWPSGSAPPLAAGWKAVIPCLKNWLPKNTSTSCPNASAPNLPGGQARCRDLPGCRLDTPEGLQQARAQDLFKTVCPALVAEASQILGELLDKKKVLASGSTAVHPCPILT